MAQAGIHIPELSSMTRALKRIEPELAKEIRRELKGVAEIGAQQVRAAVPTGPTPPRPQWRSKIAAGANMRSAYITWGRKSVPYAPWVEFGGRIVQPNRGVVIPRPFIKGGRYVYPTVERLDPRIVRAAERAFDRIARKVGFSE